MLEKKGLYRDAAASARLNILSDKNMRNMQATNAIKTAAAPYEVVIGETMDTYDIKIILIDKRREPSPKMTVKIPQAGMRDQQEVLTTIMKAVEAAKGRLQKKLAEDCDEPEIRLWAAKHRDVDLMDNSEIPPRIRLGYKKQMADERLSSLEKDRPVPKMIEQSIESDSGPVYDTPPPRPRIVKRRPRISIRVEDKASAKIEAVKESLDRESTGEVKPNVPVATVKGAHAKTPVRKPRCNNRDHDDSPEMVFDPEDGVWKCPEPGCKTIARPKSDSPVGRVQLGKGRLDLRVLFVEPGKKPSILLVSDNNFALDITDYVDMDNFLKYSSAVRRAQSASKNGEENVEVKLGVDSNGNERDVTALLRFPGMRIYGCDNA